MSDTASRPAPRTTDAPTEIGRHVLADLSGVDPDVLRDCARVMDTLQSILDTEGFHVLRRVEHRFSGPGAGFTGLFLLSESHAAVHTYPEHGYLALDVFGCGPQEPRRVARRLAEAVAASDARLQEHVRRSAAVSPLAGHPLQD